LECFVENVVDSRREHCKLAERLPNKYDIASEASIYVLIGSSVPSAIGFSCPGQRTRVLAGDEVPCPLFSESHQGRTLLAFVGILWSRTYLIKVRVAFDEAAMCQHETEEMAG
jgi:hypothetical protein